MPTIKRVPQEPRDENPHEARHAWAEKRKLIIITGAICIFLAICVVIYFMKEYDPRTIKAMRELREWLEEDANLLAPGPPKESESGA